MANGGGASGSDSSVGSDRETIPIVVRHDFGFHVSVPIVWFLEYLPRASMKGGQVSYSTPGGNVVFISFGPLGEVARRFGTLDEYRNASIARMRTQANIKGVLAVSRELSVCGHRAILSNFQGSTPSGEFAEIWSVDLWCDKSDRYFSFYGDYSHKEEFRDFQSAFTSVAQSLVCHERPDEPELPSWEWADLGFNTKSKLWFLDLFNFSGLVGTYHAVNIISKNGSAVQYQWPQRGGRPMWHVRERYSAQDISKISYDEQGTLVVERSLEATTREQAPEAFDSITYAYSLSTSRGFVEFRDADDVVVKRIDNRWIAVENLTHRTVGTYPNIRLTAKRKDIDSILVTNTCIVIEGKSSPQPG